MKTDTKNILEKILLPLNSDWQIEKLKVDEDKSEIDVILIYKHSDITINGSHLAIYDYRVERHWRHLDLWQYKTFISARMPRYKTGNGRINTVEVPWSDPYSPISILLEKK
jgi:hypothetical protein